MKAITRKHGVCVLAAAMLLAMLVMGCPTQPVGLPTPDYKPPVGMGAVKLNFNSEIQRTILPDEADINSFAVFGVEFLKGTNGTSVPVEYYTLTELLAEVFELDAGDYTLTVIGYLVNGTPPTQPAAIATESLNVDDGSDDAIEIILAAIGTPSLTEKGIFYWDITNSIGGTRTITTATMTISPISSPATPSATIDFTDTDWDWEDEVELDAGFYFVVIQLEVDGITASFRHVLHIYQNQKSFFEYTFTDDFFVAIVIDGTGTVMINEVKYEHPEDLEFVLRRDVSIPVTVKSRISVDLGDSITISVSNNDAFADDSIEWYCNGVVAGATFTMNTANAPYDVPDKLYNLSVIAVGLDDLPYSTYIEIMVVEP